MNNNSNYNNSIGVLIWARSNPKEEILEEIINIVKQRYKKDIIFFVDDLCSQQMFSRSNEAQNIFNEKYKTFFNSKNIQFYFSSQLIDLKCVDYFFLKEVINDLTLKEYSTFLPYKKHLNEEFSLCEVIHTILQELLLREALSIVSTILLGRFSQNLIFFHKKITGEKINTIIIDRIRNNLK